MKERTPYIMNLVDAVTGLETPIKTELKIEKKGNILSFIFDCKTTTFNSYSNKYNDALYNADVVEVFLTYGKENSYYEIELAPNNTLFFGDIYNENVSPKLTLLDNEFISSSVTPYDNNYVAVITIDLSKAKIKDIESIRFNAYRIETCGEAPERYLLALSPTGERAFHRPQKFLNLKDFI